MLFVVYSPRRVSFGILMRIKELVARDEENQPGYPQMLGTLGMLGITITATTTITIATTITITITITITTTTTNVGDVGGSRGHVGSSRTTWMSQNLLVRVCCWG